MDVQGPVEHTVHWPISPAFESSSQVPSFWQGLLEAQLSNRGQQWYTPNTLLVPRPIHSSSWSVLIGSPFNFKPSMHPMKPCVKSLAETGVRVAKSSAPWGCVIRQGSERAMDIEWMWSRVSLRTVVLTSRRTWCQRPSDTGEVFTWRVPGRMFPQLYLNSSSPLVSCGSNGQEEH